MKALLVVTILLCFALVLLNTLLGQRSDLRNWEFFPDMARSVAYQTQTPNPYLPDGQTQQKRVKGTIARGTELLPYGASVGAFVRAGRELKSPFDNEHPADLRRAEAVFRTYCQVCHGRTGGGDGPVVKRGFPPPPSLLFGKALNMRDGHIFHIITFGFRNMPAYGSKIDPEDRWYAIAYVRKLQGTLP